jgi:glutathione S-transferase
MEALILHHYPMSPFAEKIRRVLAFKQLSWQSVIIPTILPKPEVLALTGGYRKTPLLQIGADIYCDSALICDVLEHVQPTPTLYPEQHKGLARVLAQWADTTLFWAAMAYNLQRPGMAELFDGVPTEAVRAFGADRNAMAQGMTRLRPADATAAYKSYLRRLANMLEHQAFLMGSAPCVADFAAYHPLWFTRRRVPVLAGILSATSGVLAWMDRMEALGPDHSMPLDATEAIAVCAASTGASVLKGSIFQDEHGIALGSRVSITPETFGTDPTEGELIAATRMHYTLRRVDARAGTVRVHFPRIGYVLKALDPA